MKHLKKLVILALLVSIASCQDDSVNESEPDSLSLKEFEMLNEDKILVSDGEEEENLILNEKSEELIITDNFRENYSTSCAPDLLDTGLPAVVNIEVTAKPGNNGYFDIKLDGGDVIQAYCSDRLPSLGADDDFIDFNAVSSYDDSILAGGSYEDVFSNADEFDKVNWILNNIDISPGSDYTYGHVQYAIWRLIEGPFTNDFTDFLTPNPGEWDNDVDDAKGEDIFKDAMDFGDGYTPGCGDLLGVLLIPDDFENVQSLIIAREIPVQEECNDCLGDVSQLELEWDWHYGKRVKIYQRYENTWYGAKIFDGYLHPGETFTINGVNHDGTFGKYIYIYLKSYWGYWYYYTKIRTDCHLNIGPGYYRGVFNVISGESTEGGELCEYEPTYNCWRHWQQYPYNYGNSNVVQDKD